MKIHPTLVPLARSAEDNLLGGPPCGLGGSGSFVGPSVMVTLFGSSSGTFWTGARLCRAARPRRPADRSFAALEGMHGACVFTAGGGCRPQTGRLHPVGLPPSNQGLGGGSPPGLVGCSSPAVKARHGLKQVSRQRLCDRLGRPYRWATLSTSDLHQTLYINKVLARLPVDGVSRRRATIVPRLGRGP